MAKIAEYNGDNHLTAEYEALYARFDEAKGPHALKTLLKIGRMVNMKGRENEYKRAGTSAAHCSVALLAGPAPIIKLCEAVSIFACKSKLKLVLLL